MSKVAYYRSGSDRNEDNALSHTYAETVAGNLWPMCEYGWNRSNGNRLSIFRGTPGSEGDCKICRRRVRLNLRPIHNPKGHKTKWL